MSAALEYFDEWFDSLTTLKEELQDKETTEFEDSFSEEVWQTTYKDHKDETINDTLYRVASTAAQVENSIELQREWTEKFYYMLSQFRATAGGRIYSNIGTEWNGTTLMNCFSSEAQVLTTEGPKLICDVEIGDYVLTHKGRYKPVVNTLMKYYEGPVQRFQSSHFSDDIVSTPEHPYYQGNGNWKKSKDISSVVLAHNKQSTVNEIMIDLADLLSEYSANVVTTDESIFTKRTYTGGNGAQGVKCGHNVNRFITINSSFAYLLGRFVGDGCTFKNNANSLFEVDAFTVAFNSTTEQESMHSLVRSFETSFGITPNIITSANNTSYVRKASQIVATALRVLVGAKFDTKHIPDVIWASSPDIQRTFLLGLYDADGFVTLRGAVQIEMTNSQLIGEIQTLMSINGIPASRGTQIDASTFQSSLSNRLYSGATNTTTFRSALTKHYDDERMSYNGQPPTTGPVSLPEGGFGILPERSDEEYAGYVYNLSVEDDESYTVNNIVVHNCFVAPRQEYDVDSLDSILNNLRNQAQTLKAEGGWGENFSYIRPRGAFIHGIGVETPGAVKYMEMFDKSSEIITAGSGRKSKNKKAKGKIRKGAMMGVLDVWHPDIIEFIKAKQNAGRLTKFNISVNCTDEFMEKVLRLDEEDSDWELRFPDTQFDHYKAEWDGHLGHWEEKGYPVKIFNTVKVSYLWNLIMESTYNRAEPGVLFLDRANYFSPLNYKETIQATNPCGEQTLAPGGVCNLGSINLARFVTDDGFDLEKIGQIARYMVRFLDNINDISEAPLPEYEFSMKNKRRVGVGILGWGSALFMLRIRFGSQRAQELRDQVMRTIAQNTYMSSIDLAEEKGMFSLCEPEKHAENPFVVGLGLSEEYMQKLREVGIRNSSLLSVQPTGNTSILANVVSGGLEPIFMPEYVRTVIVNGVPEHIEGVTPKWYEGEWFETEMFKFIKEGDEEILRGVDSEGIVYKIDKNRGLTKEVLCEDYGVRHLKERNQWDLSADWAVTTTNLRVRDHVEDLKGFARWVDSAMSKTVNVPNEYSQEDFKEIYLDAYRSGVVKGVTTYRAGTMTSVLSAKEEKTAEAGDEEIILDDVKLPVSAPAVMKTIKAENRKWYLTVVYHEDSPDRPFALFVKTNAPEKNVTADQATDILLKLAREKGIPERHVVDVEQKLTGDSNSSKITRAISFCLRHGVLIRNIVNALDTIEDAYVGSFVFQIRKFLASYIKDGEISSDKCSECGSEIVYSEGCKMCRSCGNSRC